MAPGSPFGYTAVAVDRRGARIKKKLAVDLIEAEDVRLMFRLLLEGHDRSGPMGIKGIVTWLNARGHRTRGGARWGVGQLHQLLTNLCTPGRCASTARRPAAASKSLSWKNITAQVPAIVEPEVFERVQQQLKARNPKVTPPPASRRVQFS